VSILEPVFAATDHPEIGSEPAGAYTNFSNRLTDAGRQDAALEATKQAVAVTGASPRTHPTHTRRKLGRPWRTSRSTSERRRAGRRARGGLGGGRDLPWPAARTPGIFDYGLARSTRWPSRSRTPSASTRPDAGARSARAAGCCAQPGVRGEACLRAPQPLDRPAHRWPRGGGGGGARRGRRSSRGPRTRVGLGGALPPSHVSTARRRKRHSSPILCLGSSPASASARTASGSVRSSSAACSTVSTSGAGAGTKSARPTTTSPGGSGRVKAPGGARGCRRRRGARRRPAHDVALGEPPLEGEAIELLGLLEGEADEEAAVCRRGACAV
jgi:hypothetical protein